MSEEAGSTLLELVGVKRSYAFGETQVHALAGLDLKILRGQFLGIIGRSGSGKSTLLNVLGGLDQPSSGQVLLDARPLSGRSSDELAAYRRETVGFIFQSFNLIPHLTALENVTLPLRLTGTLPPRERAARAASLLEQVGLGARQGHKPAELSGGERQRVAIARALANDPGMLLCDEPTGNLDSKTALEVMTLLAGLHREGGRTIVLVTHDQAQAERYCERLVILEDGALKEDRPANPPPESGAETEAKPDAAASVDEASA